MNLDLKKAYANLTSKKQSISKIQLAPIPNE
jgi:hypothetical protein